MFKRLVFLGCLNLMLVLAHTSKAAVDVPDLWGWWPLNEGSGDTVVDITGSGNDGTINNSDSGGLGTDDSVWYNDPNRGMVLSFNGNDSSGAYVSFSQKLPALTLQNCFTWAFWAKQREDGTGSSDIIFGNRYDGVENTQWIKFTPSRAEFVNEGKVGNLDYNDVPDDVWVHLCLVKDGTSITHYRDGELLGTSTLTDTIDELPFNLAGGSHGERWSGWLSDVYLYTKALTQEEVLVHMDGFAPYQASNPSPADEETDVLREVNLAWTPGMEAVQHDVYVGTNAEDINTADLDSPLLMASSLDVNRLDLGRLEFDQTYFWRIDEVNEASGVATGKTWSFTVEPYGLPLTGITASASSSNSGNGPEKTIDESGLDDQDAHSVQAQDMWVTEMSPTEPIWIQYDFDQLYKLGEMLVWNCNVETEFMMGLGVKDVTIETSQNGQDWTVMGDYELAQGPGQEDYQANSNIDFGGLLAQSVRLTVNSAWGASGVYSLSEVRFMYIPTWARDPLPESNAVDVDIDVTLSWRPGREADTHNLYWGTDEQAVVDGTAAVETLSESAFDLSDLELDTSYYWRIEEVNTAETISSWSGPVWYFQTQEGYAIEDFEQYSDEDGYEVWSSWVDGYEDSSNGSEVDHETTTVYQDAQSMAFYYGNNKNKDSEATYTFDSQDWTRGGAQLLVLYFYGDEDNDEGDLYLKINNTQVDYSGSASDLTLPSWNQWVIDLTSLEIDLTDISSLTIGLPYSGNGVLYIDDIGLYKAVPTLVEE